MVKDSLKNSGNMNFPNFLGIAIFIYLIGCVILFFDIRRLILNNISYNLHKGDIPISVDNFLIYLKTIKGKSANTIQAYKKDLKVFFHFMLM